jgi:hypothetical protein
MKNDDGIKFGGKYRVESGPQREKMPKGVNASEMVKGRAMKGGASDISHSISDGKVKQRGK